MGRTVLEEAATPEFPRFAKALPGNPHDSSPSGTTAYRQPCRDRGRLKTSHACTDGTLLQLSFDRNKKVRFNCAETVDDADCLWKLSEKMEITWDRVGRTFLSDRTWRGNPSLVSCQTPVKFNECKSLGLSIYRLWRAMWCRLRCPQTTPSPYPDVILSADSVLLQQNGIKRGIHAFCCCTSGPNRLQMLTKPHSYTKSMSSRGQRGICSSRSLRSLRLLLFHFAFLRQKSLAP